VAHAARTSVDALAAAATIGYPVALKSAAPGLHHKTEAGGVVLDIRDEDGLQRAYDAVSAHLGPEVVVARMVEPGIEMILGVRRDPQFGPVVMIGFGGIHAEALRDVCFALPPFDAAHARRCLDRLRLRRLLDGDRASAAPDVDAFASAAARFSTLAHTLGESLREVDVNPLIVNAHGCFAVDALVAPWRE